VPIHYRRLREAVDLAILAQPDQRAALAVATLLDAGHYDIISHFDLDSDGRPIPGTLAYRVAVLASDGWTTVVSVHWSCSGWNGPTSCPSWPTPCAARRGHLPRRPPRPGPPRRAELAASVTARLSGTRP